VFDKKKIRKIASGRKLAAKVASKPSHWPKLILGGLGVLALGIVLRQWIVLIILNILAFTFSPLLPPLEDHTALFANQSTIIYDREGTELYTIHGDENRFEIPLAKMPESIKLATIAAEDDRFYEHHGFDVDGIIRATLGELGIGRKSGGSTITQQFVKNAYLSPEQTYTRKIKELMMAVKLENTFSKDEILEMYLNRIPYGSNAYGVQAAAQTFFAKNAEDLTLAESVLLASLPQAPSRYSPYGSNKNLLTGSCDTGDEVVLPDELTLTITFKSRTWLRVSTDEKVSKEWTGNAGETATFPFGDSFAVLHGNHNISLSVAGTDLALAGTAASAATTSYTRADMQELLQASNALAPSCMSTDDIRYVAGRKDYVLGRMRALDFITKEESDTAWHETQKILFKPYREPIEHPHFVFYVREKLEERYGKDLVERGGLRVFTTLDPKLQTRAEQLVQDSFPHTKHDDGSIDWRYNAAGATNAALLATDTATGQILAMVGARDYFETPDKDGNGNDGAVNLTIRPRQPGSSFKPFAYATGLLAGYTPASILWDVETAFGAEKYTPNNYDGSFMGPLRLRTALQYSRNVPAVKMAILAGEKAIVAQAAKMGITSLNTDGRYGPTIGLGAGEIPMIELLTGYSTFANLGRRVEPTAILKVTDSKGNIIDEYAEDKRAEQALDPATAYLITNILSDTSARPAGWNGYLSLANRPNTAKTGTANKKDPKDPTGKSIIPGDVWTVGYTPQITAAVWVGNNDGTPLSANATGLTTAGPIWHSFMAAAHADLPVQEFEIPAQIVQRSISRVTGKIPTDSTPIEDIVVETFASYNVPLKVDDGYTTLIVDAASGLLPTAFTPASARVTKTFRNLHSERPWNTDWEEPVQAWLTAHNDNTNAIFEAPPTETDNLHTATTAEQAPHISIRSPISGSTTQAGGIGIWVDITAPHGTEKVEYYLDNQLKAIATAAPWKGALAIPTRTADGTQLTITAKIFDKLYYADTSSVTIIVGEDTQAPTVHITSPLDASEIARGTTVIARVDAYDAGSDIARLRFELDGQLLTELSRPPFQVPLLIRSDTRLGTHRLRVLATDLHGFIASDQITFTVIAGSGSLTELSLLSPTDDTTIPTGTASITLTGQYDSGKITADSISFIAKNNETGERTTIATISDLSSQTFSAVWTDFTPGSYQLYLQTAGTTTATSKHIQVSVE